MKKNIFYVMILISTILIGTGTLIEINNLKKTNKVKQKSIIQTKIKEEKYKVYYENIQVTEGSIKPLQDPNTNNYTNTSLKVKFLNPNELYEFTMDIKNKDSIDLMIESIDITNLSDYQKNYIDFTVTYSDGLPINQKDLLQSNTKETIKVKVSLKENIDISNLPIELSLNINIKYIKNADGKIVDHTIVQQKEEAVETIESNNNESIVQVEEPNNTILTDENNNGTADVGEIITIDTERFYVISNDGINTKAIAEWNLLIGNESHKVCTWDDNTLTGECKYEITPLENATGMQHIMTKRQNETRTSDEHIGTIEFSKSVYWNNLDGDIDLNNTENSIYPYLLKYKNKLNDLGGRVTDTSLISLDEILTITGKNQYNKSGGNFFVSPYWLFSTNNYWTKTTSHTSSGYKTVLLVGNYRIFENPSQNNTLYGIRPVITVSTNNLIVNIS